MGKPCSECGIARSVGDNQWECVKLNKPFKEGDTLLINCLYFTDRLFDDNELLSPLEHLILKEQDLSSKHLRGPV